MPEPVIGEREKWDRNWGCRVDIDGFSRGWPAAVLQNRLLRVTILVGKGCDIVEVLYKPLDMDLTPRTNRGLRRREEAVAAPFTEVGSFLDQYEGGWQEILPSGGPPNTYLGATFPQHGESSNLPWTVSIVEDSPQRVEILCTTRLSIMPFRVEKRFSLSGSDATLTLSSTITNEGGVELPMMGLHHIAFGAPFVGPGSRIEIPTGTTFFGHPASPLEDGSRRSDGGSGYWPEMNGSDGSQIDMRDLPAWETPGDMQYLQPTEGWYSISSPDRSLIAKVSWDLETQPFLWFWQEFGAAKTYPWWGSEYLVGLEPCTSAPGTGLADVVASGTAPIIKAGESLSTALSVHVKEGSQ